MLQQLSLFQRQAAMKPANPTNLLEKLLKLIEADIKEIKKSGKGKLEPETALTLTRYVSAIANIKGEKDIEAEKKKKAFAKLDTQALIDEYNKNKQAITKKEDK